MTHLVIDHDVVNGVVVARHLIDVDETGLTGGRNPTGLPDPITMVQYLKWLSDNPAVHAAAGWAVTSQLAGEHQPTTRWNRLVSAVQQLPAAHPAKTVGLQQH